jgi:hypothetical protein
MRFTMRLVGDLRLSALDNMLFILTADKLEAGLRGDNFFCIAEACID